MNEKTAYEELSYYSLSHKDPTFIHQHVVDAYAAQTASDKDKPIRLTFALVGLFLHVERQLNGKQVQEVHMKLGREKQPWPVFELPRFRGQVRVGDVLAVPAGPERDEMIHRWSISVWDAFRENRQIIIDLLRRNKII